jgi:hypothetical protein
MPPRFYSSLPALLALGAAFCLPAPCRAGDKLTDSNGNLWLNYVGDHPLGSSPWGLHLEVQNRRADLGDAWQQLLVRPGINYQLSPTLSVSAGWAYVRTAPYGEYPALAAFPEHRAWEQVLHQFRLLDLEWSQRLRLEQRWIGEMARPNPADDFELANWRYENRVRYMLRTSVPLTASGKTYMALWDEVFFNFGSNVKGNHFDQNRVFLGLGRKLTPSTRLEFGYMEQTVHRRGGNIREDNHTITLWLMSKWPFGKDAPHR